MKIFQSILDHVIKLCEEGYPFEICGILLGRIDKECKIVTEIHPAKNLNRERAKDRYEFDPGDFCKADTESRAKGLEILGFYHSHPDHPSEASQTDTERAWAGYSYFIVSVIRRKTANFRSWRLNNGEMIEEKVEVIHG